MRCSLRIAAISAVLATCTAGSAAAQDDGVFVDPGSPSGKEYQIPLESARRQADPTTRAGAKVAPGERSSPLFGEGIEPEDDTASAGSGNGGGSSSGGSGGNGGGGSTPGTTPATQDPGRTTLPAATRPGAPDGGGGTTLMILGGAAVVLLAGGLGGYAMRRSSGAPA
jgi:hypothetical protein